MNVKFLFNEDDVAVGIQCICVGIVDIINHALYISLHSNDNMETNCSTLDTDGYYCVDKISNILLNFQKLSVLSSIWPIVTGITSILNRLQNWGTQNMVVCFYRIAVVSGIVSLGTKACMVYFFNQYYLSKEWNLVISLSCIIAYVMLSLQMVWKVQAKVMQTSR